MKSIGVLWVALALGLGGCSVQPWERGNLALPAMAPEPHPDQAALRDHFHASREAGSGGAAARGAGCGCY